MSISKITITKGPCKDLFMGSEIVTKPLETRLKPFKGKRVRDAVNGQYVETEQAIFRSRETVAERVNKQRERNS